MTRFKIISNPYKKEIKYQQWDADNSAWVSIDLSDHQDTKLLSKEYTASFFPFKAKQIVTQIVEDYQIDGEEIELYFEGSADEYSELEAVCSHGEYDVPIKLTNSKVYLENARDILPEVKKLFQEMSPLIVQSVDQEKIERELTRFTDASSDVVPVCVLGNYSTGKSTFINALIGSEILPNGSNPVTAKVYKIARSKFKDRASIKLNYREQKIVLIMTADETHFENLTSSNDLTDLLTEQVISMADKSIVLRMNKAVSIINDFKNDEEDNGISDLIEIEIPFVNGVLARSQHPFVLFDTPGSNSASNAKHLRVLKEAMANMTNGLPIFLATPDTLDSTDNENLYNMLNELDELDKRFTMIVVNKADKNDLNRKESSAEEEKLILRQAIPRHLYSAGIFYVSSIIGLGSKNGGEFLDDFYAETYEDQEHKYRDPENKRYKQLYTFDIMPFQIKQVFHMNHEERADVSLALKSLTSHVFITGSTGSGKSNTVYQILNEAVENDVKFLVVEPAKGEYKHVFGMDSEVSVYGTNPNLTPMLRLNPFSFPKNVHIFEHMDRLVEIFNVCWPMYAAMPAVLKNAIEKSYEDCGWDMLRSVNKYGDDIYPTFSDVARNIKTIIDTSEYDAENKGAYKGSFQSIKLSSIFRFK